MIQPIVGCAGILVADTFCGPMPRLPSPGELLAVDRMPARAGGCAANVAIDLARQDVSCEVFGCLGDDAPAQVVRRAFETEHVGCRHLVTHPTLPTSTTVILLVEGDDRRYIHTFGANAAFTVEHISRDAIAQLKVLYIGGLFAMPSIDMPALADLLQYCRSRGVITVVDVVVPSQFSEQAALTRLLPRVDYFLPNTDEARQLCGQFDPRKQAVAFREAGAGNVIVTLGADGAIAAMSNGAIWRLEGCKVQSIDGSGAGDAFAAGMITGIVHQWPIARSLACAAALGASATLSVGTTEGVLSAGLIERFLEKHPVRVVAE